MKIALETANEMEKLGIIGKYAIAGSVAVIYYAEPIDTEDLDLFFLHQAGVSEIFSMEPIYDYFRKRSLEISDFTVMIGGVRVQFVPSTGPLSDEAIETSRSVSLFGAATRVIGPEYLIVLKLTAGRGKDLTHIMHLLETTSEKIDYDLLEQLVSRFGLADIWKRFLGMTLWKKPE